MGVSNGCRQEVARLADLARQRSRNIVGLGNIVPPDMQRVAASLMLGTAPFENGLTKKCATHKWNFAFLKQALVEFTTQHWSRLIKFCSLPF
jgi:hypothetical protein